MTVTLWYGDQTRHRCGPFEVCDTWQETEIEGLFRHNSSFNNDLSRWDVRNMVSMTAMASLRGKTSCNVVIGT
jgi:hypothetical protein